MGFYIEVNHPRHKALQLVLDYGGERIPKPERFADIPPEKALIVVLDNGPFEAAGFAYDEREFLAFTNPVDLRRKDYVLLDRTTAEEASGWKRDVADAPGKHACE